MKNIIVLFLSISSQFSFAQNLVTNPSFELYDTCPDFSSQISRAVGWWSTRPTADYFNVCAPYFPHPITCVAVPLNFCGYRIPASGNGYAGIIAKGGNVEDRECLGSQLIAPLQIGNRYYASFKVSLIGQMYQPNRCGINKLGILFSTVRYDSLSPAPICSNCAQIQSDSIISDSLNWTRIKGSFVADSNYTFIAIGRLNFNSLTDSIQLSGSSCFAYYFIEDVVISEDSVYAYNYEYTGIKEQNKDQSLICFPNPAHDFVTFQDNVSDIVELKMFNINGQLIQSFLLPSLNKYTLNISNLPIGIYDLLILRKNNKQISRLIIKQ